MADPRFKHPDFGKREEDWPDLDIDSGDEDYEAKRELADAAFDAAIERSIAQRRHRPEFAHVPHELYAKAEEHQDQLTQDERALLASRGDLVGKVLGYPDSLTPEEIHAFLLWAPPDVARANIQRVTNGSLSTPTELYAKAKEAIDRGDLETSLSEEAIMLPARGFYAPDDPNYDGNAIMCSIYIPGHNKATEFLNKRMGLDVMVFQASAMRTLRVRERKQGKEAEWDELRKAGDEMRQLVPESVNVIFHRMGKAQWDHSVGDLLDQQYISRIWEHLESLKSAIAAEGPISFEPLSELVQTISTAQQEYNQGKVSIRQVIPRIRRGLGAFSASRVPKVALQPAPEPLVSQDDLFGPRRRWPAIALKISPLGLYKRESPLPDHKAHEAWIRLSEAEKDTYRNRQEQLRLVAWQQQEVYFNDAVETQPTRVILEIVGVMPQEPLPNHSPKIVTGLKMFWDDELDPNIGIDEASRQWNEVPEIRQNIYIARGAALYQLVKTQYDERRNREWEQTLANFKHDSNVGIVPNFTT